MVTVIFIIATLLLVFGLIGSMIPGLPGPPLSFIGILIIHFFTDTQFSNFFLFTWASIIIIVFLLEYLIQVWGVNKFGGDKKATIGTFLGLFAGSIFPPLGLFLGPFIGAFIGALTEVKGNNIRALKVAIGSIIGFIFGTILKLVVSSVLFYYAIYNIYF